MVVLAAAAHPDDIEFMMAGTLLLLKRAGAEIHMWNLANVETKCIPAQTTNQVSFIMRFLEIQWEQLGNDIHKDTTC